VHKLKGGHRDAFSNERREAPHVSRGEVCTCHVLIDSTFEQSEDIVIAYS
jgi:hypothetical protein